MTNITHIHNEKPETHYKVEFACYGKDLQRIIRVLEKEFGGQVNYWEIYYS